MWAIVLYFEYDDRHRVISIRDAPIERAHYFYDAGGRLQRVSTSDGVVRVYTYGPRDELLTIDDPGRRVENTYGADGRVVRQVTRWPGQQDYVLTHAYTVRDGSVWETDVRGREAGTRVAQALEQPVGEGVLFKAY